MLPTRHMLLELGSVCSGADVGCILALPEEDEAKAAASAERQGCSVRTQAPTCAHHMRLLRFELQHAVLSVRLMPEANVNDAGSLQAQAKAASALRWHVREDLVDTLTGATI